MGDLINAIPKKERLRCDEAARIIDCDVDHVYDLIQDGSLDAIDIRGKGASRALYRVYTASVRRFLDSRRVGAELPGSCRR